MPRITRTTLLRVASLLGVIAIVALVYSLRDQADRLAIYGYPGIFLISFLANATVFLPAPGVAVVFMMGAVFNPLMVGLVAGVGASLGELTGYLAGYSGQGLVENTAAFARISPWVARWGALAVFVFALVPNPFFDAVGIAAGMLKMPLRKFLPALLAGKALKMLGFAYAGAGSLPWLQNLIQP
jgi:membrane protein YqaA with SNARE-associated domain